MDEANAANGPTWQGKFGWNDSSSRTSMPVSAAKWSRLLNAHTFEAYVENFTLRHIRTLTRARS